MNMDTVPVMTPTITMVRIVYIYVPKLSSYPLGTVCIILLLLEKMTLNSSLSPVSSPFASMRTLLKVFSVRIYDPTGTISIALGSITFKKRNAKDAFIK